jgi:hypothetical protein
MYDASKMDPAQALESRCCIVGLSTAYCATRCVGRCDDLPGEFVAPEDAGKTAALLTQTSSMMYVRDEGRLNVLSVKNERNARRMPCSSILAHTAAVNHHRACPLRKGCGESIL